MKYRIIGRPKVRASENLAVIKIQTHETSHETSLTQEYDYIGEIHVMWQIKNKI